MRATLRLYGLRARLHQDPTVYLLVISLSKSLKSEVLGDATQEEQRQGENNPVPSSQAMSSHASPQIHIETMFKYYFYLVFFFIFVYYIYFIYRNKDMTD